MGTPKFLKVALCIALVHCSVAYPSQFESDEDITQQQSQNVNMESLEEFTQKIQVKGRKPEKVQVVEPEPEPYDPCLDSRKIGPCKGRVPRYFFNDASGNCERFSWGGCAKSGNNFKELSECETSCSKHLAKAKMDVQPTPSTVVDTCEKASVKTGPECVAYIPRWTYNTTSQRCEQFIWGGCRKTENNFATQSSCESTCGDYAELKGRKDPITSPMSVPKPRETVVIDQQNANAEDVCNLPSNPGLCMAIFEKYFFNKLNNRCELFTYGGCGGNKNRFDTAEDCVRACGGDSPVQDSQCSDVQCPWALYEHYKSLGCSPIYDGEACCPTRYECPDQHQQNNTLESRSLTLEKEENGATTVEPEITPPKKCRYRGKLYSVGDKVDEASDSGSCRAACRCVESSQDSESRPKIICANIECAEHLQGRPPGKENCIPLYKKNSCCASEYHCPEGELTIVGPNKRPNQKPPLAKCNVDGESVYEGQRVYPKKSPCSKCVCERNPANSTSLEGQLYCENIDCGIEIYYTDYLAQGCAPIYFEKADGTTSCCPISWQCPDDTPEQASNTHETINTTPGTVVPPPPQPPSTDSPTTPSPNTNKPNSPLVRSHEACMMPKSEGTCKGHRPRFFYNAETEKCETFIYTGCKGNFNNFASYEDCRDLCEPQPTTPMPPSPPAKGSKTSGSGLLGRSRQVDNPPRSPEKAISLTEVDPCTMPRRVGRCKGYFPRFHYSPEDNECNLFIFGGCSANANNFYTKDSCEATCLNKIPVENLKTNVPATLAIPAAKGRLQNEGGDASRVNFGEETVEPRTARRPVSPSTPAKGSSSEEEDACSLLPRTGRCKAYVPRFYYDADKKMCKSFTYGGCSGNANNFKTVEECNERCNSPVVVEVTTTAPAPNARNTLPTSSSLTTKCKLPKQAGSCHASVRSYYYDVETKSCKLFFYSGCFGNANRFSSREDCENVCKKPLESEGSPSTHETINQPGQPQVHDLSRPETSNENPVETFEPPQNEFCKLDPAPGNCKANQLRFYYDSTAAQCLPFVYTGCSGNQNNFVTEVDCMSTCSNKPTLEQLADEMVLSCSFGNKTLPLGATIGGPYGGDEYAGDELPCGVPVCQCITPPAVTCVQRMCPEPTTTTTPPPPPCPTPTCLHFCREAIGLDGCPTCDCDHNENGGQSQAVVKTVPVKSVKG